MGNLSWQAGPKLRAGQDVIGIRSRSSACADCKDCKADTRIAPALFLKHGLGIARAGVLAEGMTRPFGSCARGVHCYRVSANRTMSRV